MRITFLTVFVSFLLFMNISDAQEEATTTSARADVIFINGDILPGVVTRLESSGKTQRSVAGALPHVQALAVKDSRIIALGSTAEIKKLADKRTHAIDLGGHFAMPGFNDAHLHLAAGGLETLRVSLIGVRSLAEMQARIGEHAKSTAAGEWIVGSGWDETLWADAKLPTRQDVDAVTGDHPAFFGRVDGHIAVANTEALKRWGITRGTVAPAGGKIDQDATGEVTGILRESAKDAYMAKLPKPTPSQRRRGIELALQDAASHGLTSVQDNSDWDDFLTYEDLEREGKLTVRISEWLPFQAPVSVLNAHRSAHEQSDSMLHTTMLKGFMDGSLGSRTAAMLQPYADDPENKGIPQYTQDQLNEMANQRVAARFQMGFHAIGDKGVQMALDAFEGAERYAREHSIEALGSAKGDWRFRIEHAQVIAPGQVERFRELGVIASMQPNHLLTDMKWAMQRLGPERAKGSYAWKEMLDHGVALAFGTDYPVEPLTPFRGLYAAVTRRDEQGKQEYYPEQKISIEQAIAAYTTGAAYAEFAERDKGTLKPGMLADFVVLDRDITKVSAGEILGTKVLRTVVGGKTVFAADGQR